MRYLGSDNCEKSVVSGWLIAGYHAFRHDELGDICIVLTCSSSLSHSSGPMKRFESR